MESLSLEDFYFGAALSVLFDKKFSPIFVESGKDKRIYDISTDSGDFRIFMKYTSSPHPSSKDDEIKWQINFNDSDLESIRTSDKKRVLICVLGKEALNKSRLIWLNDAQIEEILISLQRSSFIVKKRKNSRGYKVTRGGGMKNDFQLKSVSLADIDDLQNINNNL